jgi:predicted DNA-binding protein
MSHTFTLRLTKELTKWLEATSKQSKRPIGAIIRSLIEKAKEDKNESSFMHLAGAIEGHKNLSKRKGFSKK